MIVLDRTRLIGWLFYVRPQGYPRFEVLTTPMSLAPKHAEIEKKKLAWACRRGMLELDLLLMPFLTDHYDDLTAAQQQTFANLLSENDQTLYAWLLTGNAPDVPSPFSDLVATIRATEKYRSN